MARIYISSTYEDLKDFRDAVFRGLKKLNHEVICMEDYVASDERPLDRCLMDVDRSDIYIGIFAWRYGFTPNNKKISITELEYREALLKEKPCLLFLLDGKAPWPGDLMDQNRKRINDFRVELSVQKLASFFESKDDLVSKITTAVVNYEKKKSSKITKLLEKLQTMNVIHDKTPTRVEMIFDISEDDIKIISFSAGGKENQYLEKYKIESKETSIRPESTRQQVFIGFSNEDERWFDQLKDILKSLEKMNFFIWDAIQKNKSKLKEFFDNLGINWINNAKINKSGDKIDVFLEKKAIHLELIDNHTKVILYYHDQEQKYYDVKKVEFEIKIDNQNLILFKEKNVITDCNDKKIKVFEDEFKHDIGLSKVAILLVTPKFLTSNFMEESKKSELKKRKLNSSLKEAESKGLRIFWISVSASMYMETDIKKYQCLNEPSRPLETLSPEDLNTELGNIGNIIKFEVNLQ